MSWTYPLSSTSSSTSLSTSVASPWQPTDHNPPDASFLFPLSGSSSSSLAPPASEPSAARRAKPLTSIQRKPLASSTSSAEQPPRDPARPRLSTAPSNASISKPKYIPREEEPEAMAFIELLKDVSKQLDQNSEKKQRVAARAKEKERERSLGRSGTASRTGLHTADFSARPLTKTSSASAICPVGSSTRPVERTSSASMSTCKHEPRGRVLAKTASWGAPGVDLVSGKSTRTSFPSTNLNCDLKLASSRTSNTPNMHPTAARKASTLEPPDDGDSAMEDVIDLTETNTEWERPLSGPMSRTDTATYMQVDDDDVYSDTAMDVSFFQEEAPPQTRAAAPKPKLQPPQPNTALRPPAPTQRTRTGPPPLGMRRAPQFQPSQYSSSQGSKSVTVPRFKPPLLANGGTPNKSRSGTKPTTMTSSKPPPRGKTIKVAMVETAARRTQDADSSFDVSFDVDADALEEAMKAYD